MFFGSVSYNSIVLVCSLKFSFQVLCVHPILGNLEHIYRIGAKMWIKERWKAHQLAILWNFENPKIVIKQNAPGLHTDP